MGVFIPLPEAVSSALAVQAHSGLPNEPMTLEIARLRQDDETEAGRGARRSPSGPLPPTRALAADAPAAASRKLPSRAAHASEVEKHWGLIEKYCFECRNTTDWAGGIAFDYHDDGQRRRRCRGVGKSIRRLRGRLHAAAGQAATATTSRSPSWSGTSRPRWTAAAKAHTHVGRVGLHRLNRREYANAVMDLLGLDIDADGAAAA